MRRIMLVAGARPNFMKVAPLMRELRPHPDFEVRLIHTGQHFSPEMSDLFFRDLGLPEPDLNLEVGGGSHARQTAEIMVRFEQVLENDRPDLVCVVGDVNSTVACALVAKKLGMLLAHIEAGLRSFDRGMPEEINRLATDALTDLFFTTEESGTMNLLREGVPPEKIYFVGNLMIDSLRHHLDAARRSGILDELGLGLQDYILVTLHRPSNVDEPQVLRRLWWVLSKIAVEIPVIFPIHPRTRARLENLQLTAVAGMRLLPPLGYLDFLQLMSSAKAVLTDSGGIQEETTALGVPCLTLRENTERPVTLSLGTNRLVGANPENILSAWREIRSRPAISPTPSVPLWDGRAAARVREALQGFFNRDDTADRHYAAAGGQVGK